MFSQKAAEQLHYYVYRLIDPRNGQTFYVGKGKGNRVFSHAKADINTELDEIDDKLRRIREIKKDGFEVTHVIHRHGLDEKTAFEVEAALIDAYPEATNKFAGHHSGERGIMHAQQVIKQYRAKETPFQHSVLMVIINRSVADADNIYDAARYAWRLDIERAKRVEFVLALRQGLVVGVFIAEKWMEATSENFSGRESVPGRWGFEGREAPEDIKRLYLGTRYIRKKGAASPVLYSD